MDDVNSFRVTPNGLRAERGVDKIPWICRSCEHTPFADEACQNCQPVGKRRHERQRQYAERLTRLEEFINER